MIVIKLSDGLGNQLFQYAYARYLKEEMGIKVYIDIRYINNEDQEELSDWRMKCDKRKFELNNFQISIPVADSKVLKVFDDRKRYAFSFFSYRQKLWLTTNIVLYEPDTKIIKDKYLKWHNYYVSGYFFCTDYMIKISSILLNEIRLKKQIVLPEKVRECLVKKETVSVHIRRGDFLRIGRTTCESNYYNKAVSYLKKEKKNLVFLIFSDDIEWVKSNLVFDAEHMYISDMGFCDYEELIMMSMCKNNIIANSTFSYWGAWLNANPNKLVIAPKGWRRRIIPDEWIRI